MEKINPVIDPLQSVFQFKLPNGELLHLEATFAAFDVLKAKGYTDVYEQGVDPSMLLTNRDALVDHLQAFAYNLSNEVLAEQQSQDYPTERLKRLLNPKNVSAAVWTIVAAFRIAQYIPPDILALMESMAPPKDETEGAADNDPLAETLEDLLPETGQLDDMISDLASESSGRSLQVVSISFSPDDLKN